MKNILNDVEIEKSIKKITMYKEKEDLILDDLKSIFKNINYNYNCNNKDNLESKENDIINKTKTMAKNHSNNILIFQKNLQKYKDTSKKVAKMFDNI